MRSVRVVFNEGGESGEIYLPTDLSLLLRPNTPLSWGQDTRITSEEPDLLSVDQSFQTSPRETVSVLTDIQNGLLIAAVANMRLIGEAPDDRLDEIQRLATLTGLSDQRDRVAHLAFWRHGISMKGVTSGLAPAGLCQYILTHQADKTSPRLSLIIPEALKEWGMEKVLDLKGLRASPILTSTSGQLAKGKTPFREKHPRIYAKIQERRRPDMDETSHTEWESPFWSALIRDVSVPPPLFELDRLATHSSNRLLIPRTLLEAGSVTLMALWQAWLLGLNGGGLGTTEPKRVGKMPPHVRSVLTDRARVIDALAPERDLDLLRSLTRISALQAWRIGIEGRSGAKVAPVRPFKEEMAGPLRFAPLREQRAVYAILRGEPVPPAGRGKVLQGLREKGLINDQDPPNLTGVGRKCVGGGGGQRDRTASITELLRPTTKAMGYIKIAPIPRKKAAKRLKTVTEPSVARSRTAPETAPYRPTTEWADQFRGVLIDDVNVDCPVTDLDLAAQALCVRLADRSDKERTRLRLLTALRRAFRVGKTGETPKGGPPIPLPQLIDMFLTDRARALEAVTRPDPDLDPLHHLLRISLLQAWRIGVEGRTARFKHLEVQFREETPVVMWALSAPARALLIGLEGAPLRPEADPDAAAELLSADLVGPGPDLPLTASGGGMIQQLRRFQRDAPSLRDLMGPDPVPASRLSLPDLLLRRPPDPEPIRPKPKRRPPRQLVPSTDEVRGIMEADLGEQALFDLLIGYWREGRYGERDESRSGFGSVPRLISNFLKERARAIWAATELDRADQDLELFERIVREQAQAALDLGVATLSHVMNPAAAFRDECSVLMRSVPHLSRDLLLKIYQDEISLPLSAGGAAPLVASGHLFSARSNALTNKGVDACLQEITHRSRDLPWLRPGGPRYPVRAAEPEVVEAEPSPPPAPPPAPTVAQGLSERGLDLIEIGPEELNFIEGVIRRPFEGLGTGRNRALTRFESRLMSALSECWLAGVRGPDHKKRPRMKKALSYYFRERSRVLTELIGADEGLKTGAGGLPLLRDSAIEAFRLGVLTARRVKVNTKPRFAEEYCQEMRLIPYHIRSDLLLIRSGEAAEPPQRLLIAFENFGLSEAGTPFRLTPKGERAADNQIRLALKRLPSVLSLLTPSDEPGTG